MFCKAKSATPKKTFSCAAIFDNFQTKTFKSETTSFHYFSPRKHRQTDISTYRKHRPRGPMLWEGLWTNAYILSQIIFCQKLSTFLEFFLKRMSLVHFYFKMVCMKVPSYTRGVLGRQYKLDGLASPITDPPTNKSTICQKKQNKNGSCNMWHMSCNRFGKVNFLSKLKVPSSYSLGVNMFWRFLGKGSLREWLTESVN